MFVLIVNVYARKSLAFSACRKSPDFRHDINFNFFSDDNVVSNN